MSRQEQDSKSETQGRSMPSRAPYKKPRLLVFGDVAELTRNIGILGKNDPGNGLLKTGL